MTNSIQEILEQLSLEQKTALVTGADFWHSHDLSFYGLPAITFSDGPHGLRYQAHNADHLGLFKSAPAVCFPTASALANSWDPDLAYLAGEQLGLEAKRLNADVVLGPGLNIIDNPKCGRAFEYFSEDPYLSGQMAGMMAKGIQKNAGSCLKHFALNRQETNRQCVNEITDLESFMNHYGYGFKKAIEIANPDWVMSSYNKVNGVYANENPVLLQDVLRDQYGFQGAVMSDWGGSNDCIKGIQAGCSLEMPGTFGQSAKEIVDAIKAGKLSEKDLDARAMEVLKAMEKVQKRKEAAAPMTEAKEESLAKEMAFTAACQSLVLLKNEENILPLDPEKKWIFVGPFGDDFPMQGGGSSKVETETLLSMTELLKEYGFVNSIWIEGYNRNGKGKGKDLALLKKLLPQSDGVIMLMAYPEQETLEGVDRKMWRFMPAAQRILDVCLSSDKPIILADAISGPKAIDQLDEIQGLIHMGLAGQMGREALLSALKGDVNPSGKLAQSWLKKWADYPSSKDFPAYRPKSIRDLVMTPYAWQQISHVQSQFPFGYGLSYSDFKVSKIRKEGRNICFHIENCSDLDGCEVVELFVSKDDSAKVELKGFEKICLKAHESKEISLPLEADAFVQYSSQDNQYKERPGRWKVSVSRNGLEKLDGVVFFDIQEDKKETTQQNNESQKIEWEEKDQFHDDTWPLNLTSPLGSFENCPNPVIAAASKAISSLADLSLRVHKPSTVLLALKDMPLKSLQKTSAHIVAKPGIEKILETARNPKASSVLDLAAYLISSKGGQI